MKLVTVSDIVTGAIFAFVGWSGVDRGVIRYWGVSAPYPRLFGWALIAFGLGIPIAAYILRSRQNKSK
jgi:hypothetical protein